MAHKSTRNAKNGVTNHYKETIMAHKNSRVVKKSGRNYKEITWIGVEIDALGNKRQVIKHQSVRL